MPLDLNSGFRLGDWEIYPELNRVVSNGETFTLEGKVMAVLVELARQPRQVVQKTALFDSVWPKQAVADGVLTRAIHELRHVLGDDATTPDYIETVPRRGYRLLCEPAAIEKDARATSKRLATVITAILVASVVIWVSTDHYDEKAPVTSVAVLPFANLTGSPEKDYVGDGLAEAVIHSIAQQPELGVIARTSSFALRDSGLTIREIGERLGVDRVVEGSVREERGIQRITIQLINTQSGLHDGSVTLDVIDGDLFNAQQRISKTIENMLADAGASIQSTTGERLPATVGQAYDLFLKGRAALHNRSAESLQNAHAFFQEALRLDPGFSAAHAGLAQFYLVSRVYLQLDSERSRQLAFASSRAALDLDPGNVDAIMVAAAVAATNGDYESSIEKFELAVQLQPSNAQAHQWYGETLLTLGYVAAGRDSIERALQLNPLAGSTNSVRARAAAFYLDDEQLLLAGDQGSALGAMMAPRALLVHYFRVGDAAGFERELRRYHAVIGVDPGAADLFVKMMTDDIERNEFLNRIAPLGEPRDNFFSRELALLGFYAESLDAIARGTAIDGQFMGDIWLPEYREVRALPGFVELLRPLEIDDYWRTHGLPDACQLAVPEPFCAHFAAD